MLISPSCIAVPGGLMFYRCYFLLQMSTLSFDNAWPDRNANCCVKTIDEKVTTATYLVKFDPVTPELLWLIYMDGECT